LLLVWNTGCDSGELVCAPRRHLYTLLGTYLRAKLVAQLNIEDKGAQLVVNIEAVASLVLACHRQGSAGSLMPEANIGYLRYRLI